MLSSPIDIALIAGVALLVFGPKRFPEIGKALGQGIGNFKKSLSETQNEIKQGIDSVNQTEVKEITQKDGEALSASTTTVESATENSST